MKTVKPGTIIRVRDLNHVDRYGKTTGFRPDNAASHADKQSFVVLVLGVEPLYLDDNNNAKKALNVPAALSALGYTRTGVQNQEEPDEEEDVVEDEPELAKVSKIKPRHLKLKIH